MVRHVLNSGFIVQKLAGKTVIYSGETSCLYEFNETASFIFAKLKNGWDTGRIVASLAKRYSIPPARAAEDVESLVSDLVRKKILSSGQKIGKR